MASASSSKAITQDIRDELSSKFDTLQIKDPNAPPGGFVTLDNLNAALEAANLKLPKFRIRELQMQWRNGKSGDRAEQMDAKSFFELLEKLLREKDPGLGFHETVKKVEDAKTMSGFTSSTVHVIKKEEQAAFADWINRMLGADPDCKPYLPLAADGEDLYEKCSDSVLLCKLINHAQPGTIFDKAINYTTSGKQMRIYQRLENGTLALNSARSLGVKIVNIDPTDINKGTPWLLLGIIWQIIKIGLLSEITLAQHSELVLLLEPGESLDELRRLTPEQLLMRWVNYHLAQAGIARRIKNFDEDLKDSEVYTRLLKQVAPTEKHLTLVPLNENDLSKRAELMLQESDKIGCRVFISPESILAKNEKLNLAFLANLFNNYPGLQKPAQQDESQFKETREEKTYRNWMNSLGVNPYVSYLYTDLRDGLILFQIYDIIQPGIVDWKRVHQTFSKLKGFMERIENCNYVVELGKKLGFSLVGIGGEDINSGNQTLTLAVIWQTMRAYTLAILNKLAGTSGKPIAEKEIVAWANERLKKAGKTSQISGFSDSKISDGVVIIDLLAAIRPSAINYDWVIQRSSMDVESKMKNANYAITASRKAGAPVYALPEDIVEVKQKMVLTVFACLMTLDIQPQTQPPATS